MDWIQLLSSLIAIVLLAWGATKLFPTSEGLTVDRILKNYARFAPASNVGKPIISNNQKAALLPMQGQTDEIGIVTQLGDRLVCRTLTTRSAVKWKVSGDCLVIEHGDFTQPSVTLPLSPSNIKLATEILSKFDALSKRTNHAT